MGIVEAYHTVAKHVFVAYLIYSTERREIIIFADNAKEAQEKASAHFQTTCVTVERIAPTNDPQVYKI